MTSHTPGAIAAPAPGTATVPWIRLAWFGALLLILFWPVVFAMGQEWANDEDMSHGFFVPAVAAYITWQRRDELAAIPARPSASGYLLVIAGFLLMMAGQLGVEFFLARVGLLVTLLGMVLALHGPQMVRTAAFPLFLLVFMIRIPSVIYNQITLPLQLLASQVAETVLMLLGIPVYREGNVLELAGQKLSVVEACSGIRSLLSLSFLSLVYGYLFESRHWLRVVLFFSTVPIAITANAARVSMTGVISEYKPEFAQGIYHTMEGWVIFMIALAGLVLTHRLLLLVAGRIEKRKAAA
jgi:exosortase